MQQSPIKLLPDQKAIARNKIACNSRAAMYVNQPMDVTMTNKRDYTVYVRDNLSDTGQVPNPDGVVWSSPDTILWHQNLTQEEAQALFGTTDSYATNPGTNLYPDSKENYMYVRIKNTEASDTTVTLHLWQVPADLLNYPGTWDPDNLILSVSMTAKGTTNQPNGITVSEGIQLKKTGTDKAKHYCFISEIVPSGKTALLPGIGKHWWEWTSAMTDNNTLAQHNYYLVAPNLTTITNTTYSMSNTSTAAPSGPNAQIWITGHNLPLNCVVTVWTPDIASGNDGHLDNRSNPLVITDSVKQAVYNVTLPAAPGKDESWSTPLTLQWTYPDGVQSEAGQSVRIDEYTIAQSSDLEEMAALGMSFDIKSGEIYFLGCATIAVSDNS